MRTRVRAAQVRGLPPASPSSARPRPRVPLAGALRPLLLSEPISRACHGTGGHS